ncbi:MAG: Rieske 2Fe-2S domain-containing protein [Nocardioidaceae bacterium]
MSSGGRTRSASPFTPLLERLEQSRVLDAPGKAVGRSVRGRISAGPLKDALSGTWLGHPLHPLLTDVTIGSFVSASLLDVLGGDSDGRAAERLLAIGLASAAPTALSGVSDWTDSELGDERVRRVGLVHAAVNDAALVLFAASLVARRRGNRGRGKALGLAGGATLGLGGYLGAHLSFFRGVGPNRTAFDEGPKEWTAVAGAAEVVDGEPTAVVAGDTPVLLVRHGGEVHALHDRCSHRGCPLSKGSFEGETVTCFCHGSQFDLRDGSILRGPATAPQPVYEVRERDGRIELRLPEAP